ncbi:sugar ABC transporter substrate-binding protein [Paraburkholderia sp. SIMBA_049]
MEMARRTIGTTSVLLVFSLVSIAAAAKEITLGFVAAGMQYPFNVAAARGFQDEARKLGAKSVVLDAKGSVEKQGNAIDDLITQKTDGIASILIDSVVAQSWVDRAAQNNVNFVATAVQVGDPDKVPLKQVYPKLTALVADDDVLAGDLAGEFSATLLSKGRTAQIGIVEGAPGYAVVKQRDQGFEQGLRKMGVKYRIVGSQPTDWTAEKGEAVCQNMLAAHPDVDLFFAQYDDLALGCLNAIRSAGSKAKVVTTSGGSRRGIEAIKSGDLAGAICSKPETMGRLSAKALYGAITNKDAPKAQFVTYKRIVVTKDNLSECPPEF